jgi:hypothetical protein
VQLLVESLLRCSLDASMVVTDASISDVYIFILLPLGSALTSGHWTACGEC